MLNESGYERETNCTGMLRTSSKLQCAQRVHRACRIRIHANEPATAWPDPPRLTDYMRNVYDVIICNG